MVADPDVHDDTAAAGVNNQAHFLDGGAPQDDMLSLPLRFSANVYSS